MQAKPSMNNYFRKKSKIPMSIKIFFLILHLLFGYDFGFSNLFKNKISKLLKFYSTVLTTIICVTAVLPMRGYDIWVISMQYLIHFCILKSAEYTVYHLLSDIHAAERIDDLEKETFGIITATYAFVMFIANGAVIALRYMSNNIYLIFVVYAYLGIYLYTASEIVIYYYVYTYIKNMKKSLKYEKDINKLIARYNNIADCFNKIRRLCDNIVSIFECSYAN